MICCSIVEGTPILREQFGDGAGLAFGGCAVVAPNVKDQRVVEFSFLLDFVNDAADMVIAVFDKAGVNFPSGVLERLFVFRNRIPTRRESPDAGVEVGHPAESSPSLLRV